jgi:hypothetical protein
MLYFGVNTLFSCIMSSWKYVPPLLYKTSLEIEKRIPEHGTTRTILGEGGSLKT